ncbi:hypothetical protein GCM10017752_24530 [Streptomyces roseoviridis]
MAVPFEQELDVGEGGVEGAGAGAGQDGGGQGLRVGRGQHEVRARDRNRRRHVGLPRSLTDRSCDRSLITYCVRGVTASALYPGHLSGEHTIVQAPSLSPGTFDRVNCGFFHRS